MEDKPKHSVLILVAIIGVIGSIIVAVIGKWDPHLKSEQQLPQTVDPNKLVSVIKDEQRKAVRISYSETDCFTYTDLENFRNERKTEQIINDLSHQNSFINIVIAIKKMQPVPRQEFLNACSNTAKPTWDQLRNITPEGQTNAGHEAELMISTGIVRKVFDLIRLTPQELEEMYQ